jgi:mannitol/fructose-specific phosphotransferase system IIA component (Ntr-type)
MELLDRLDLDHVVSIRSKDKRGALEELVRAACRATPGLEEQAAGEAVWAREAIVSSWVAPGVAIPHGRLAGLAEFVVVVGRSRDGVQYEASDGQPVHLLVLILGRLEEPDRHIAVLAETARLLRSDKTRLAMVAARGRREILEIIRSELSRETRRPEPRVEAGLTELMLEHAMALAREVRAAAILVLADAMGDTAILATLDRQAGLILVTQRADTLPDEVRERHPVLEIPISGLTRADHTSLSVLFAISRGLIGPEARMVSLFGEPGSGRLDNLLILEAAREVSGLASVYSSGLLGDVSLEVLQRVLQLSAELGREGREGNRVGAIFVLGDYENVREWCHQMVMNPFKGYRDEEKSILDPSLSETVKEFSTIDGAFLVRGDGVIEAAGAYLRSGKQATGLRPGLGARHNAAATITEHTQAAAVVLSQSTGHVSLFRGGQLILELDQAQE